jgi:hypothetical protein
MKRFEPQRPLRELPPDERDPLAAAVHAALAQDPAPERLARLGARLDTAIAAGAEPSTLDGTSGIAAANGSDVARLFGAWRFGAGVIALGALIAGAVLFARGERASAPHARPVLVEPPPASAPANVPLPAPPPAIPLPERAPSVEPALTATPTSTPAAGKPARSSTRTAAPRRETEAAASDEPPVDELELLRRAQQALTDDAHAALSHVQAHARAFPHGLLAQEREVLAITALIALGNTNAARDRATAFAHAFPTSAHRRRVQRLLDNSATAVPPVGNPEAAPTQTP